MYGIRGYSAKRRPLGVFGKVTTYLVMLLLAFMLVQSMLLSWFGVTTTAVVYNAEQKEYMDTMDNRLDPSRFELSYRYRVSDKTYEGTDIMYFQYGYVTEIGTDGKEIPKTAVVRYFPPVPSWSEIVSVPGGKYNSYLLKTPLDWFCLVLLVLLIAFFIIRGRRARKRIRSESMP